MQVAPTDYEISIISGSYGGHRQHKRHDGQSQGFDHENIGKNREDLKYREI